MIVFFGALAVGCGTEAPSPTGQSTATSTTGIEGADAGSMDDARRFVGRSNASIDASPGERIDLVVGGNTLRYDASCNEVEVGYELVGSVLNLSDSGTSTVVGCSPQQDANAPRIRELLSSRPTFTVNGDTLTISSPLGELALIDSSAPHPDDLPLIGTDWSLRLVVFQDTGGFMSLVEPPPIMRFDADGIELVFRCRTAHLDATVDIDAGTITFAPTAPRGTGLLRSSPMTSTPVLATPPTTSPLPTVPVTPPPTTLPPCDPNTPTELEQKVIQELVGALEVEVDIDELHLRAPDRSGLDLIAPLPPLPE